MDLYRKKDIMVMSTRSKICILNKYLISKGVSSPLKLQKLLPFFRYEEILSENLKDYCFNKKIIFKHEYIVQ